MGKMSLAVLSAAVFAAAPAMAQDNNDQVNLRVIHAVPGAPAASISIGNTPLFENIQFQQVSVYKALPQQDDQKVKITLADGRTLQTKEEFSFDNDDNQYTILIAPDESAPNPKVVVLEDDVEDVEADETELTLINASPTNKSLRISLDDNRLEGGVNFTDSDDEDVKPGSYKLSIFDTANETPVATKNVTLTGGTAVTVVVMGQDAVKIVNNEMPDQDLTAGTAAVTGTTATGTGTTTTGAGTRISTTTGTAEMQEGREPGTGTMVDQPTTPIDDM